MKARFVIQIFTVLLIHSLPGFCAGPHGFDLGQERRAGIPETAPRLPNVGCKNPDNKEAATTAKVIASKLFLGKNEYNLTTVGVKECHPHAVESLLGKPQPLYFRAPDPVCGVALGFKTREDARKFLNALWDGKIQPDRAQGARIKLTSEDTPLVKRTSYVPICPEVTGPIFAQQE